jgi:hypothetical protein
MTDNGTDIKKNYLITEDQNIPYINHEHRFYASTGSMMKTYAEPGSGRITYGEKAGYEPSEIGFLVQTVQDGKVVDVEKVIL